MNSLMGVLGPFGPWRGDQETGHNLSNAPVITTEDFAWAKAARDLDAEPKVDFQLTDDAAWEEEAKRRVQQYRAGEFQSLSAESVHEKAERLLE